MTNILETVLLSLALAVGFVVYAVLMSSVLPRFVLRVSYRVQPILGRGLKKFTYPDGRAVLYESRPAVRKYVPRYVLYTVDGFKYVQLLLGQGVESYHARIVMVNNKNRVIGMIELSEITGGASKSRSVRLDDRTSYVAVSVSRVNGENISEPKFAYTSCLWIAVYLVCAAALSFLMFRQMYCTADEIFAIFGAAMPSRLDLSFFFIPSLLIGITSVGVLLRARMKKGIGVALK